MNRTRKRRLENLVILSFAGFVIIGVMYLLPVPLPTQVERQMTQTTRQQTAGSRQVTLGFFTGVLLQGKITGKVEAVVEADTNCQSTAPNMLTCVAIINDGHGQELRFKYTHDMRDEKCLESKDHVIVAPVAFDTVTVTRI